jgi:hypothetical protein
VASALAADVAESVTAYGVSQPQGPVSERLVDPASPPPDREALDFHDVGRGDSPTRILHLTAPADGMLEATLPEGSPYRILSIQTYSGVIVPLGAPPRRSLRSFSDRDGAPSGQIAFDLPIERERSYVRGQPLLVAWTKY